MLLLDLREEDEYDRCHIHGAKCYPARLFRHQTHPFSAEFLEYRNREPERAIIVYDEADVSAAAVGNLLYEKGVDNVFVLSGGLRRFFENAPDKCQGELPTNATTSGAPMGGTRRLTSRVRALGGALLCYF